MTDERKIKSKENSLISQNKEGYARGKMGIFYPHEMKYFQWIHAADIIINSDTGDRRQVENVNIVYE